MHDDVHLASLLNVYGLLLGKCGYQTDRKIYDQSEIAARLRSSRNPRAARACDKIIHSLRENYYLTYYFPASSYVAEITHPFAMADQGS